MARGGRGEGGKGRVATHWTDGPAAFPGKEEHRKKSNRVKKVKAVKQSKTHSRY